MFLPLADSAHRCWKHIIDLIKAASWSPSQIQPKAMQNQIFLEGLSISGGVVRFTNESES
jgi:hypothetical protein